MAWIETGMNNGGSGVELVTWADGTDEQIAAMLEAHYAGEIDVTEYWNVGDERTVHLSAMAATGVGESHVEQDVTMVLMNKGGKTLVTPINGITECVFIVGQKEVLENDGYMNSTDNTYVGWRLCPRRTWCNNVYKEAIPSTLRSIFKEHENTTATGPNGSMVVSNDYFALPAEIEIFGSNTYAINESAYLTQFKYYETSTNIRKIRKYLYEGTWYESNNNYWWTRSPHKTNSEQYCCVSSQGTKAAQYASNGNYISPFGVI